MTDGMTHYIISNFVVPNFIQGFEVNFLFLEVWWFAFCCCFGRGGYWFIVFDSIFLHYFLLFLVVFFYLSHNCSEFCEICVSGVSERTVLLEFAKYVGAGGTKLGLWFLALNSCIVYNRPISSFTHPRTIIFFKDIWTGSLVMLYPIFHTINFIFKILDWAWYFFWPTHWIILRLGIGMRAIR